MARTQVELEAAIDALSNSISKGIRKAKMNGEEVEFNSPADMRRVLRDLKNELAGISLGGPSVHYARTTRGL